MSIDALTVEILNEKLEEVSAGETGEVIITSLVNKALSLIRYRQEDYAVKSEIDSHDCGINLPIIIRSTEERKQHTLNKKITQKKIMEILVKSCEDFWNFQLFFDEERNATLYPRCFFSG